MSLARCRLLAERIGGGESSNFGVNAAANRSMASREVNQRPPTRTASNLMRRPSSERIPFSAQRQTVAKLTRLPTRLLGSIKAASWRERRFSCNMTDIKNPREQDCTGLQFCCKDNWGIRPMTKRKSKRNYKRLVLGDVIEIPLSRRRFAYAQYTYYHRAPPVWGHLIRVLPRVFASRPENLKELVQKRERFYAFFPAGAAVSRGWVTIVSQEEIPVGSRKLPLFKACNQNFHTGKKTWYLCDGKRERRVGVLLKEHYDLPLQEIISFDLLVERIETGWSPRDEV